MGLVEACGGAVERGVPAGRSMPRQPDAPPPSRPLPQAEKFQKTGKQLRNKFWWQNCKMKLVLALAVILLAVVIFLIACFSGGKNCTKR